MATFQLTEEEIRDETKRLGLDENATDEYKAFLHDPRKPIREISNIIQSCA